MSTGKKSAATAHQGAGQTWQRRIFIGLAFLWIFSLPLSVAVAEIALWAAAALWVVDWIRRELFHATPGEIAPPGGVGPAGDVFALIGTPVMAFWGASVVSAMISRDPIESLWELREGFLFVAPLVAYLALGESSRRKVARYVFAAGLLVAIVWGLVEAVGAVQAGRSLGPLGGDVRPDGPLSHYMTYAGLLMIAVPVLLSIRNRLPRILLHVLAASALFVIALTMTRSAWIGCAVGLLVYGAVRWVPGREPEGARPPERSWAAYGMAMLIVLVVGATLLMTLVEPATLQDRTESIFSLDNPTNRDRLAMAAAGLRIVRHYPFFGIGPGLVHRVYPAWRVEWAVKESNPHLHNNLLQIAAERGLVGLGLWIWMMAAFVVGAWRLLRHSGPHGPGGPEARAALAALAAFLAMGIFEYNFSDSEVLMTLLFVCTLPFAASSAVARAGDSGSGA